MNTPILNPLPTQVLEQYDSIQQVTLTTLGTSLNGFWADSQLGSNVPELSKRGKVSAETMLLFKEAIEEGLQFLVEDGRVKAVSAEVSRNQDKNRLDFIITVTHPDGMTETLKLIWGVNSGLTTP